MNSKAEITEKALKMENVFTTQSESALINNDKLTVPGFSNIGNTCYANSILQSLLNTSKLRQFLLRKWVFRKFLKVVNIIAKW
ncbi:hypothetical protein MHBO_005146 [Bonamia ostreae]|uniref:USP domain-containing protein n=1 Tax=Bonamia ostreae TaxID=126728 RepID=A0ABV2AV58_9EUKA